MEELPVILMVEDEYALQGIAEAALEEAGFAVDVLSSAEEALTLFGSGLKRYKVLVTDVNLMGSLSGWELARRVREREPGFPVIYMTGAVAHQWPAYGVPHSILLEKPFAPAQLVTAVSQLLNVGGPPA